MKFNAVIDKKYIVWQRHNIELEAENIENAKKKIEEGNGLPKDGQWNYIRSETMYDTEIELKTEQNKGLAVFELKDIQENVPQS